MKSCTNLIFFMLCYALHYGTMAVRMKDMTDPFQGTDRIGVYTGDLNHENFPDGLGVFQFNDNSEDKYDGFWKYGDPHGYGTLSLKGEKYTGDWRYGVRHGSGELTDQYGRKYTGSFRENKKAGNGTMEYPDKSKYTGKWRNNQRHGEGILESSDGIKTLGTWKNDQLQSIKSTVKKQETRRCKKQNLGPKREDSYDGECNQNDQRHGEGTMKYPSRNYKQIGIWKNDVLQEIIKDIFTDEEFECYERPKEKDEDGDEHESKKYTSEEKKQGNLMCLKRRAGTLMDVFIGTFKENGDKEGPGVLYSNIGVNLKAYIQTGSWVNNSFTQGLKLNLTDMTVKTEGRDFKKRYKVQHCSQSLGCMRKNEFDLDNCFNGAGYNYQKYRGDLKNEGGKVHKDGHGELVHNRGKYTGGWKKDSKNHFGYDLKSYGASYIGEYEEGIKHGFGVEISLSKKNRTIILGEWKYGVQTGGVIFLYPDKTFYVGYLKNGRMKDMALHVKEDKTHESIEQYYNDDQEQDLDVDSSTSCSRN